MIPNVIHFIFGLSPDFGGKPFSLVHHLAVKSACEVNRPDRVFLHHRYEPTGPWWERTLPYVEPVPIEVPESIGGAPLKHVAHRADVARLRILAEQGGIYLDMDVLCVRPFTPLLGHRAVMGEQLSIVPEAPDGPLRRDGLCSAVIMAEPRAEFIARWLTGLEPGRSLWTGFRSSGYDEHWDEYSVRYPDMLASRYPDSVHVEGHRSFFWPSWNDAGLDALFGDSDEEFPDAYCHHLWEMNAWDRYLGGLTEDDIRVGKSPFAAMARRFLPSGSERR